MQVINLNRGLFTIVDDDDFDRLNKYKWSATNQHGFYYALTKISGKPVRMQRFIMNAPKGKYVDHINHNTLDNRKSNLRIVSPRENVLNSKSKSGSTSIYKGVSLRKTTGRFEAYIRTNGKRKHLGFYDTEEEAAKIYDQYAKEYYKDHAFLNFPPKLSDIDSIKESILKLGFTINKSITKDHIILLNLLTGDAKPFKNTTDLKKYLEKSALEHKY